MADAPETRVIEERERYTGQCRCGYRTTMWPNRELAELRLAQHSNEHETGELMQPMSEFMEENKVKL